MKLIIFFIGLLGVMFAVTVTPTATKINENLPLHVRMYERNLQNWTLIYSEGSNGIYEQRFLNVYFIYTFTGNNVQVNSVPVERWDSL